MAEILTEFLIPVSFKVDPASESRMKDSIRSATLQSNLLADAIEGALKAFGEVMRKVADNLDAMFYASQRTAASVENIKAFGYAAAQLGSSVGEANSALEAFGKFLRSSPGAYNLLEKMGVRTKDGGQIRDTGRLLEDLGAKLATMPRYMQQQYASMFGISDKVLFAITSPEFRKKAEERRAILRRMGLDESAAAEASKGFAQALGRVDMVLGAIATKVESAIVERFGDGLRSFGDFLIRHGDDIAQTLSAIVAAAAKVGGEFLKGVTGTNDLDAAFVKILKTIRELSKWIEHLVDQISDLIRTVNKFGEDSGITWLLNKLGYYGSPNENPGTWPSAGGGGVIPPGGIRGGADTRSWWQRHAPSWLGGKDAPGEAGSGSAPAPGAPGKYRPVYKLTDRDLSDAVVNTIAGEASYKRPGAVDAVINNMLNRVGSKGWGPSGDLHAVARAPGQYAGYKRASAEEAAYIRDRIRAIASGGVPDNTNGSNAYRASWYSGPWMRKWGVNGVNVGGNVFAYEPNVRISRDGERGFHRIVSSGFAGS